MLNSRTIEEFIDHSIQGWIPGQAGHVDWALVFRSF